MLSSLEAFDNLNAPKLYRLLVTLEERLIRDVFKTKDKQGWFSSEHLK